MKIAHAVGRITFVLIGLLGAGTGQLAAQAVVPQDSRFTEEVDRRERQMDRALNPATDRARRQAARTQDDADNARYNDTETRDARSRQRRLDAVAAPGVQRDQRQFDRAQDRNEGRRDSSGTQADDEGARRLRNLQQPSGRRTTQYGSRQQGGTRSGGGLGTGSDMPGFTEPGDHMLRPGNTPTPRIDRGTQAPLQYRNVPGGSIIGDEPIPGDRGGISHDRRRTGVQSESFNVDRAGSSSAGDRSTRLSDRFRSGQSGRVNPGSRARQLQDIRRGTDESDLEEGAADPSLESGAGSGDGRSRNLNRPGASTTKSRAATPAVSGGTKTQRKGSALRDDGANLDNNQGRRSRSALDSNNGAGGLGSNSGRNNGNTGSSGNAAGLGGGVGGALGGGGGMGTLGGGTGAAIPGSAASGGLSNGANGGVRSGSNNLSGTRGGLSGTMFDRPFGQPGGSLRSSNSMLERERSSPLSAGQNIGGGFLAQPTNPAASNLLGNRLSPSQTAGGLDTGSHSLSQPLNQGGIGGALQPSQPAMGSSGLGGGNGGLGGGGAIGGTGGGIGAGAGS